MGLLRGSAFLKQRVFCRNFHYSAGAFSNVPISRFEPNSFLPYEKIQHNVKIVQQRHVLVNLSQLPDQIFY